MAPIDLKMVNDALCKDPFKFEDTEQQAFIFKSKTFAEQKGFRTSPRLGNNYFEALLKGLDDDAKQDILLLSRVRSMQSTLTLCEVTIDGWQCVCAGSRQKASC